MNSKNRRNLKNLLQKVKMLVDKSKLSNKEKWKTMILIHWLKLQPSLKKCFMLDLDKKLYKIAIVAIHSKTMTNYPNGLHKTKKNITLKNNLLPKNNSIKKKKDSWLLMQEYPRKLCKLKSERKLECKRNLKRYRKNHK